MESHGQHKRPFQIYWLVIGIGLGIMIGASTQEWGLGLMAGTVMGIGMAIFATKPGVDQ